MKAEFLNKKTKGISCLTCQYCKYAPENELTEVFKWHNGDGYDIVLSRDFRSTIFSVSHAHLKMILEMIDELNASR